MGFEGAFCRDTGLAHAGDSRTARMSIARTDTCLACVASSPPPMRRCRAYPHWAALILSAAVALLAGLPAPGQTLNTNFEFFKQFIVGQVPVREAVVYTTLTREGKLVNEEWFRFAYQPGDTWFVQRLIPDATITNNLVPRDDTIVGASTTTRWNLGAKVMEVVDKAYASGSNPEQFGAFYSGLVYGTMNLQLPIPVEWHGLEFTNAQGATGQITLENGRPAEAKWAVRRPGSTNEGWDVMWTRYDYAGSSNGLPRAFTLADSRLTHESRFVSLVLGTDPKLGTNGYIPAMFSPALKEIVIFWTNDESYLLTGGRLQSRKLPPGARVYTGERRVWPLLVLVGVALITAPGLIFLAVRNKH
jgi:hypothetical protein